MTRALILAAAALALTACSQNKDGELRTLVGRYLDHYTAIYGGGLGKSADDAISTLNEGQSSQTNFTLEAGVQYVFIGACDNECQDIDLAVTNLATGEVVARDNLADNYPVVGFMPEEEGNYEVLLMMYRCTIQPCYAGARFLSSAAPAEAAPDAAAEPEAAPTEAAAQ